MLCSGYIYSSQGQQLNFTPHDLLDVSFFVLHFKNEGSARIIILYSHELVVPPHGSVDFALHKRRYSDIIFLFLVRFCPRRSWLCTKGTLAARFLFSHIRTLPSSFLPQLWPNIFFLFAMFEN